MHIFTAKSQKSQRIAKPILRGILDNFKAKFLLIKAYPHNQSFAIFAALR